MLCLDSKSRGGHNDIGKRLPVRFEHLCLDSKKRGHNNDPWHGCLPFLLCLDSKSGGGRAIYTMWRHLPLCLDSKKMRGGRMPRSSGIGALHGFALIPKAGGGQNVPMTYRAPPPRCSPTLCLDSKKRGGAQYADMTGPRMAVHFAAGSKSGGGHNWIAQPVGRDNLRFALIPKSGRPEIERIRKIFNPLSLCLDSKERGGHNPIQASLATPRSSLCLDSKSPGGTIRVRTDATGRNTALIPKAGGFRMTITALPPPHQKGSCDKPCFALIPKAGGGTMRN